MTPERLLTVIAKCKQRTLVFIINTEKDLVNLTPYLCLYSYAVKPMAYMFNAYFEITLNIQ